LFFASFNYIDRWDEGVIGDGVQSLVTIVEVRESFAPSEVSNDDVIDGRAGNDFLLGDGFANEIWIAGGSRRVGKINLSPFCCFPVFVLFCPRFVF